MLVVAAPIFALTAFGGGGGDGDGADRRASATVFRGGKTKPARASGLVSAAAQKRALDRLVKLALPVYCAGGRGNYVALTFDDGPSKYTPLFQDLIRRSGIRVTWFIVGGNMESETLAAFARTDAKLGAVADHTWTHARLTDLSEDGIVSEITRAKTAIEKTTGRRVRLFRPPFAARNSFVGDVVTRNKMVQVLWNTDSRDWSGVAWQQIGDNVSRGLRGGSIIIMHDTRPENLKALEYVVIPELKRRGLKAVTLPELFALDPPSESQLRDDAARGACGRGQWD